MISNADVVWVLVSVGLVIGGVFWQKSKVLGFGFLYL